MLTARQRQFWEEQLATEYRPFVDDESAIVVAVSEQLEACEALLREMISTGYDVVVVQGKELRYQAVQLPLSTWGEWLGRMNALLASATTDADGKG